MGIMGGTKNFPSETTECIPASGVRIRQVIRKITKNQKKAQLELMKISSYMLKNVFPGFNLSQPYTCVLEDVITVSSDSRA
jgi:hypothetical protein